MAASDMEPTHNMMEPAHNMEPEKGRPGSVSATQLVLRYHEYGHGHHHHNDHRRSQTTLQDLPREMLDMVLMKAVLELIRSAWDETAYQVSTDMYSHLATVWSEWYYRLTTRWFRLVLKRKLRRIDPSSKYLRNPLRQNGIQLSIPIWGLTIIDNDLFVVSMRLPSVLVYDKTSLVRRRCHEIDDLRKPRDIASLANHRLLFVVECGGSPYWIHCIKPNGEFVTKWDVGSDPRNLSVANGNEVLVTCNESIKVYTKDGVPIRDVRLANDAPVVWQAIQLSTGYYVICQGFQSVTPYHRISLLQGDGTLTKWFGGARGAEVDELSNPFHMSVDKDECILVVDTGNKRLRLFTPKLVHVRDILTGSKVTDGNTVNHSITAMSRHFLDGKTGRMYIGTNSGQLMVFRVLSDAAVAQST